MHLFELLLLAVLFLESFEVLGFDLVIVRVLLEGSHQGFELIHSFRCASIVFIKLFSFALLKVDWVARCIHTCGLSWDFVKSGSKVWILLFRHLLWLDSSLRFIEYRSFYIHGPIHGLTRPCAWLSTPQWFVRVMSAFCKYQTKLLATDAAHDWYVTTSLLRPKWMQILVSLSWAFPIAISSTLLSILTTHSECFITTSVLNRPYIERNHAMGPIRDFDIGKLLSLRQLIATFDTTVYRPHMLLTLLVIVFFARNLFFNEIPLR